MTNPLPHDSTDPLEDHVPRQMAKLIVDVFKIVDIKKEDSKILLFPMCNRNRMLIDHRKMESIRDLCQRIGHGLGVHRGNIVEYHHVTTHFV